MRFPRRPFVWLAVAAVGTVGAQAPQQPVFRAGVRLVAIDVTVVDDDGRPVRGLEAADFDVTINGVRRRVQTVDFLESAAVRAVAGSPDTPTRPVAPAAATRGARTFLLLFDDLSFTPLQGKGLNAAAERMLQDLEPGDLVGVTTTSALGPVLEPTRDREAVRSAIASLAGRNTETAEPFYIGVHEAVAMAGGLDRSAAARLAARECQEVNLGPGCGDRVRSHAFRLGVQAHRRFEDQLAALTHVMAAMTRAPSPRVVIMLSAGTTVESAPDLETAMDDLSDKAAAAGVQLYAIADVGDDIDLRDRSEERSAARREEGIVLTRGLQTITHAAGGTTFRAIGTADRFFDRIVSETSAVYELGVELPTTVDAGESSRTKVNVRRRGAIVRSTGRAIEKTAAPSREDAIRLRLAQGGASYGVPLTIATRLRRHTGPGVQVVVDARVPADVALPLSLRFALIDAAGRTAFAASKDVPGTTLDEHQVIVPLPVPAGAYRLRVVAADGPGNIGSVELPVTAELTRAGDFEISDLLVTYAESGGAERFTAGADMPPAAERLTAVLELHPRGAMPRDVVVRFMLLAADDTTMREVSSPPAIRGDRWTAAATLSIGMLSEGRYMLRAQIFQGGERVAELTRSLRWRRR